MNIIVDGSTDFHEKTDRIKPTSIPVEFARIPQTLKRLKLWVVWAYVWKDGRWCKLPFQPVLASDGYRAKTGWKLYAAKSNDPSTWSDYETVAEFHQRHPDLTDGIGVMLQDGLLGADLDKCRDKATGEVSEWGLDLVRRGDSYTEVSPSGTGLKTDHDGGPGSGEVAPGVRRAEEAPQAGCLRDGACGGLRQVIQPLLHRDGSSIR